MKLCIVASGHFFGNYGGGQVYVRSLVDELIRQQQVQGIELSVITTGDYKKEGEPGDGQWTEKDYHEVPVYTLGKNTPIEALLTEIHPDVVHANDEKAATALACKSLGIPCIVTAHHGGICCPAGAMLNTRDEICQCKASYERCLPCFLRNYPTGLFWYPILKHYSRRHYDHIGNRLRKMPFIPFVSPIGEASVAIGEKMKDWQRLQEAATVMIAPSEAIGEAMVRNGAPSDKIKKVPHGIRSSQGDSTPTKSQKLTGDDVTRFYYASRICHEKGVHILLEAFHPIGNPKIELHLFGGAVGKQEQRYQRQLQRRYKNDRRIVWHGKLSSEAMAEIQKDYDALIHPAICLEIFGLDIAEAMAAGKYVISTRCGGPEIQIHNENEGTLVPPNDVEALRQAMIDYAKQPRMGGGKARTIAGHVGDLLELYKSVMSC